MMYNQISSVIFSSVELEAMIARWLQFLMMCSRF
jgi:hypothetical protein